MAGGAATEAAAGATAGAEEGAAGGAAGVQRAAGGAGSMGCAPCGYDLVGVVHHVGSSSRGHYTAHVAEAGEWFFCDDGTVSPSSATELLDLAARGTPYILLYIRGKYSPFRAAAAPAAAAAASTPTATVAASGGKDEGCGQLPPR